MILLFLQLCTDVLISGDSIEASSCSSSLSLPASLSLSSLYDFSFFNTILVLKVFCRQNLLYVHHLSFPCPHPLSASTSLVHQNLLPVDPLPEFLPVNLPTDSSWAWSPFVTAAPPCPYPLCISLWLPGALEILQILPLLFFSQPHALGVVQDLPCLPSCNVH